MNKHVGAKVVGKEFFNSYECDLMCWNNFEDCSDLVKLCMDNAKEMHKMSKYNKP